MKGKSILVMSAAVVALGFGPTLKSVSAQSGNSQCDCSAGTLARQIVQAQVEQAVRAIPAQMTAAIAQTTTREVQEAVQARVEARLVAAVARQQAAASPRARVLIDGQDMSDGSGWLGVSTDDVSEDRAKELKLSSPRGVYLQEVEKDSPAEKAGLKSGDVITEFNGQHVEGVVQFRRLVRETPPGHSVSITVWRDGHAQTVNATLSTMSDQFSRQFNMNMDGSNSAFAVPTPMPAMPAMPPMAPLPQGSFSFRTPDGSGNNFLMFENRTPTIGISTQNLNGQLGTYFGAPDGEGVLVENVQSDSPAEKAGLKAGDVITKLDGTRVRTSGELQSQMRAKREDKTVQLSVVRRGSETTVTVEPKKPEATRPARTRGTSL